MRALVAIGLIIVCQIRLLNPALAGQVTLAWTESSDPTVVGYNLYYGTASRAYTNVISAGFNTSITVSNLALGTGYYFAATAVDMVGLESEFSSEVFCQVAGGQCTITLASLSRVYDGTAKPVAVSTTPAGIAVKVTYNGTASPPVLAGNYQVIASVNDLNYSGASTGTLTIAKAPGVVQLNGLTQIYDGKPKAVTASTSPLGLPLTLTYNGTSTIPYRQGTYTVIGLVNSPNYFGGATNTLTISKTKGRPAPFPTAPQTGISETSPPGLKSVGAPPVLTLNWTPINNTLTILESSDLVTWTALTNVNGADGSLMVPGGLAAGFFIGTSGTNRVFLQIQR